MLWVVYETGSQIIRRVIVPDPGMQPTHHVQPGESLRTFSGDDAAAILPEGADGPDLEKIRALLTDQA